MAGTLQQNSSRKLSQEGLHGARPLHDSSACFMSHTSSLWLWPAAYGQQHLWPAAYDQQHLHHSQQRSGTIM